MNQVIKAVSDSCGAFGLLSISARNISLKGVITDLLGADAYREARAQIQSGIFSISPTGELSWQEDPSFNPEEDEVNWDSVRFRVCFPMVKWAEDSEYVTRLNVRSMWGLGPKDQNYRDLVIASEDPKFIERIIALEDTHNMGQLRAPWSLNIRAALRSRLRELV